MDANRQVQSNGVFSKFTTAIFVSDAVCVAPIELLQLRLWADLPLQHGFPFTITVTVALRESERALLAIATRVVAPTSSAISLSAASRSSP